MMMDVLSTVCGKAFIIVAYSIAFGSGVYNTVLQEFGIVECSVAYSIALKIVVYSTVLGIVVYNTVTVSFILVFSTGDYNVQFDWYCNTNLNSVAYSNEYCNTVYSVE